MKHQLARGQQPETRAVRMPAGACVCRARSKQRPLLKGPLPEGRGTLGEFSIRPLLLCAFALDFSWGLSVMSEARGPLGARATRPRPGRLWYLQTAYSEACFFPCEDSSAVLVTRSINNESRLQTLCPMLSSCAHLRNGVARHGKQGR